MNNLEISKLIMNEVYEYFDEPILFSCFDHLGNIYFAISIEDNEDAKESIWYYVQTTQYRYLLIRSGELPLNVLVKNPEFAFIYEVTKKFNGEQVRTRYLEPDEVPIIHIPEDDYRLNCHNQISAFNDYDLEVIGKAYIRRMLEIRLLPKQGAKSKLIEAGHFGLVLVKVQDFLKAASLFSVGKDRQAGRYPEDITERGLTGVTGFSRNGMVKVQVASMTQYNLLEESYLDDPLQMLGEWMNRTPSEWTDYFKASSITIDLRRSYQQLMMTLGKKDFLEYQVKWTRSNNQTAGESRIVTAHEANFVASIFSVSQPGKEYPVVVTGKLEAIDIKSGSFSFSHEEGGKPNTIRGKANEPKMLEHLTSANYYTFLLTQIIEKSPVTNQETSKYTLHEIRDAETLTAVK